MIGCQPAIVAWPNGLDIDRPAEGRLGKRVGCKPSRVRIPHPPATIRIVKNGGPGRWPATGMGSGRACAVTVLPDMEGLPSVGWVI